MAESGSRNQPRLHEQVKAAYQSPTGRLPSAKGQALARQDGHLASLVQVSLDEPRVMRHMHGAAEDLRDASRLDVLLPKILDGAMSLTGADFGNVQLLDPLSGALRIVTQSGFGSEFTDYFAVVDDDHSACGRAARQCAQTVIADVTTDPGFAPHREIAAAAGFRAVQSTPLADSAGRLIGMVSTHFRHPGRPADRELRSLELFGDIAGEAVARHLDLPGDAASPQTAEEGDGSRPRPPDQLSPPETVLAEFADHVVYRLFAAGLSLASAQALVGDGAAGDRVAAAVEELDRAIRDIRITVVDLADRRQLLPTPPEQLPPRP
ncbi:MAG TPA: GAF domain-containing protein [Trebonia sp.]